MRSKKNNGVEVCFTVGVPEAAIFSPAEAPIMDITAITVVLAASEEVAMLMEAS